MSNDRTDTKVRMHRALHRRLLQVAEQKGVSLNSEMAARLQASLDHENPKETVTVVEPDVTLPVGRAPGDAARIAALEAEVAELRGLVRRPGTLPGKLSATKIAQLIRKAKDGKLKQRRFGDGGNLELQITNNGAGVSWEFRWTDRASGCDRRIGLGSYHDVDLDVAREKARQLRVQLAEGKDPKAVRDGIKDDAQIAARLAKTVSQVVEEYFEAKLARKSLSYRTQATQWFKTFLHDKIGTMSIQKVDRKTILDTVGLRKLWTEQHPTALGLQNHLSRIFNLAIANKYYRGENPAAWDGGLEHVLPASVDVHQTEHHDDVKYKDIGYFMQRVRAYVDPRKGRENVGRTRVSLAIEFIVLVGAVRCSEVLEAQWKEIDLERMIWTVPWQHLKSGKHHQDLERPITKPMRAVLEEMQKRRRDLSPDGLVFPSSWTRGGGLNRSNLNQFMREQLKWEYHVTVHGFRSTLRDWCRVNRFPDLLWMIQADHKVGKDKSDQSYGHDKLLEQRRGMMELWGEYCSKPAPAEPKAGEVLNIADKRRTA